MNWRISAAVVCLALAACSDPMSTKLSMDESKWSEDVKPIQDKLSDEERRLMTGYMVRAITVKTLGGEPLSDQATTVGDAIKKQRVWIAAKDAQEQAERAERQAADAAKAKAAAAISEAVSANLLSVSMESRGYAGIQKVQVFKVKVDNKTDKAITGVSGLISILNQFGTEIGSVSFEISEELAPKGHVVWTGVRDYNEFIESHKALVGIELGKHTTKIDPRMVVYADGTKLGQ